MPATDDVQEAVDIGVADVSSVATRHGFLRLSTRSTLSGGIPARKTRVHTKVSVDADLETVRLTVHVDFLYFNNFWKPTRSTKPL